MSTLPEHFFYVTAVVALGGFVHGATGFGFALTIMPLLGPVLGMGQAVPLMNMLIILLSAQNLYANRHAVLWGEAFRLMAAAAPGLALGVLFLRTGDPLLAKRLLGMLLLAYGAYALLREFRRSAAQPPVARPFLNAAAGLSAGFFGGACATDGPPVIVYGNTQGWHKERFRGILQAFFLFNAILLSSFNVYQGYFNAASLNLVLLAIPLMIVGSALGHLAAKGIPADRFRQGVLAMIVLLGVNLVR